MATKTQTKAQAKSQLSYMNYLILMLVITLIVIGVTVLVGKGLVTTIIRDTKVIAKKNAADKQLSANLIAADMLISNYNGLGPTRKLVENALPATEDFSGLIAQLENMGNVSGVVIKDITPSNNSTPGFNADGTTATQSTTTAVQSPQSLDVSVTAVGGYSALNAFLRTLQNAARPMRVTSITSTGSGSDLNSNVTLTTYYSGKASIPFTTEEQK